MELYQHQIDCLAQTKDKNRVGYFLDMGLGKTFVGAEKMMQLGSKANLIICQKSKIQDWIDHFETVYYRKALDITKQKTLFDFVGACIGEKYLTIGVINYELAWRRKDLLQMKDFTLLLDESSLIQNPTAKQTKFILKMKPANVILLSGTPTGGKYENLWTQMKLLGWNITEQTFDSQYVNRKKIDVAGFTVSVVDKSDPYKNVDRLKRKMREHGSVFMKTDEVMNLPDQIFQIIKVPVSKEYKSFCKHQIVKLEDGTEIIGDSTFSFRIGQKKLCGAYSETKVQAFKDLIDSTNGRLIVFYNFNSELERLIQICVESYRPYSLINGETKDLEAYESESDSVTLVQYKAGSMGLNLQKSNKIVYFSLTEESELFEQSKKRIHRIGQNRPCFYYLLCCENSIEDKEILPTLNLRKEYTDDLFRKEDSNGCPVN